MAKGAHLTKQVKNDIALIHREHPDWGATKLRKSLLLILKKKGLDRNFGPDWPSVSAVQKELTEIRKNIGKKSPEFKGLDEPWSLGSLKEKEYNILPEALPTVMSVYQKALAKGEKFTIREAQWVGRLYKLIDSSDLLWEWAWAYATEEWLSEIADTPFDTTELDREIVRNPLYAKQKRDKTRKEITFTADVVLVEEKDPKEEYRIKLQKRKKTEEKEEK